MIPISREPKRFVAALNKFRFHLVTAGRRDGFLARSAVTSISYQSRQLTTRSPQSFSTAVRLAHEEEPSPNVTPLRESSVAPQSNQLPLTGKRTSEWWTGKAPLCGVCPGVAADGKIYSLPQLTWEGKSITKESLQAYFDNTWTLTEVLFSALQGEEAFSRPPYHDLRHPMIFYYGHPAALYVNKLRVAGLLQEPINPYFESIFETGVDEMSWDDLSKNKMPWPSVQSVHAYRKVVYQTVSTIIQNLSQKELEDMGQGSPLWSLVMGFEHERIHIETSSFLMNEMPLQFLRFPDGFPAYHPSVPSAEAEVLKPVAGEHYPVNEMVEVPAQNVKIGKPRDFPSFGWDNEYGEREFAVPAFRASKFKVSNGEFLEFVRDGGYARNELWTEIGWKWRAFRNVKWPTFWQRKGPQGHHQYDLRLLFDLTPMPWDWPVVVNYHEASAFAKWKSLKTGKKYRLLCETEHRAIRDPTNGTAVNDDHAAVFGGADAFRNGVNANLAYSSMSPVNALPENKKGFHDVFGNAWEWMEDYFCALPGFQVHPFYEDFSTPCFDGLHNVIQGGSFISTGNEASVHARFHFRPHFYQHASFRLVEQVGDKMVTADTDAPGPFVGNYPYRRSQEQMAQALSDAHDVSNLQTLLSRHFGHASTQQQVPVSLRGLFQQRDMQEIGAQVTNQCRSLLGASGLSAARVLEVGCGAGGLALQLAQVANTVVGVEHNLEAVQAAKTIWSERGGKFTLNGEGDLASECHFALPANMAAEQVEFRCADPMCLPAEMKDFDVVVLNDVLAKVSSPNAVLGRLGGVRGLVRPGGVLVVMDGFEWSENRTPRSLWLGGYTGADGPVSSADTLKNRLAAEGFVLAKEDALPQFWRDSQTRFRGQTLSFLVFQRK